MFRTLTEDEVRAGDLWRTFLYGSVFTVDNLTAILMDTSKGEFGLHENIARAKAHAVIAWLKTITGVNIPERREEIGHGCRPQAAES